VSRSAIGLAATDTMCVVSVGGSGVLDPAWVDGSRISTCATCVVRTAEGGRGYNATLAEG